VPDLAARRPEPERYWPLLILADQFTLSEPGGWREGADYTHQITPCPPPPGFSDLPLALGSVNSSEQEQGQAKGPLKIWTEHFLQSNFFFKLQLRTPETSFGCVIIWVLGPNWTP
jgi:hypothetical protein